ncbi:radical SAM protein [Streptomyces boncukensis]|uniref:radical SAM protein n=1 Tax=Streptomyces boncukensis TaxID=2711219 RepID=UPI0019CF9E21|nr:radical SAM protein [Streptomyces boncukensis]
MTVPEETTGGTMQAPINPPVRTALISAQGHFGMGCGCCVRADRTDSFLDPATYALALSQLKETGVEEVCLSGGEPVHHPQIIQLIRQTRQLRMPVSMTTSARTVSEVITLSKAAPLLAQVTVCADSQGAGRLRGTTRTAEAAISTLRVIRADVKILHVTCWEMTDDECAVLASLASEAKLEVQFSPGAPGEHALPDEGMPLQGSVAQQELDATLLDRYFTLPGRYRAHLRALRDLRRPRTGDGRWPCRSASAYVSADGSIQRCPHGQTSVTVHAPPAAIRQFLAASAQDHATPDCASLCHLCAPPLCHAGVGAAGYGRG